ncbi:MAG: hypothetical protein M1828_001667 [Chrysothrix sp. TS-e1954]|nr:MAG: hypothetical protein M1828_001667 [Chrysothrix sp. TS-e1954]
MTGIPAFKAYHSFANFIASDIELWVYKRFDSLGARNLLYLQTELLEAERQLAEHEEQEFSEKTTDVRYQAQCWETFAQRAQENAREHCKMELILRVRRLLKEYQKALLLRSEVLKLRRPTSRVFEVFSGWFEHAQPFIGTGRTLLQDPRDFVALGMTEEPDRLSTVIQDLGGKCLRGNSHTTEAGVKYYSASVIQKIVSGVTIALAALLLEGAIVALYLVTSPHVKLVLLAVFTCLFATSVGLLTNARRAEVFAGTAAYAAVLVVFVSGTLSGP